MSANRDSRLWRTVHTTFSALGVYNYRRFFVGQSISLVGTWMQTTAQAWLVLTLTNSATDLGLVIALQTLPIFLLGPYGGVIADRVDKRRLMVVLQSIMGVQALVLGVLTVTQVDPTVGGVRPGRRPRAEQHVREPGSAGLRPRDGRADRSAQRRDPQLGHGQCRPGRRPGRGRRPDRDRRRRRVLPGQRGELRGGGGVAGDDGQVGARPERAERAGQGPDARGLVVCAPQPWTRSPPAS